MSVDRRIYLDVSNHAPIRHGSAVAEHSTVFFFESLATTLRFTIVDNARGVSSAALT